MLSVYFSFCKWCAGKRLGPLYYQLIIVMATLEEIEVKRKMNEAALKVVVEKGGGVDDSLSMKGEMRSKMKTMSSAEVMAAVKRVVELNVPDAKLEGKNRKLDVKQVELVKQLEAKVGMLKALLSTVVSSKEELKVKMEDRYAATVAEMGAPISYFGNIANYVQLDRETGRRIGTGTRRNGLWYINHEEVAMVADAKKVEREIILHHCRLGHPSFDSLSKLYSDMFKGVDKSRLVCDACEYEKHIRTIYLSIGLRSCEPFMVIHSDVWGPRSVTFVSRRKWFVTFINCYIRMTWIYVLKHKNEVFQAFQDFHKLVSN